MHELGSNVVEDLQSLVSTGIMKQFLCEVVGVVVSQELVNVIANLIDHTIQLEMIHLLHEVLHCD
jgi:hypothetical protein